METRFMTERQAALHERNRAIVEEYYILLVGGAGRGAAKRIIAAERGLSVQLVNYIIRKYGNIAKR